MALTTTLGILTARGVAEIAVAKPPRGKGVVIVGLIQGPWEDPAEIVAKRERLEIARTYAALGYDVYQSLFDPRVRSSRANRRENGWPNDLYIQSNGIVIPAEGPFTEIGKGGYFVFGEDFVLVSSRLEDVFRRQMGNLPGFRRAFAGKRVYFIEPYVMRLQTGFRIKRCPLGGHIDLTLGYVPRQRLLTVAGVHYATIESKIQAIARRHGLKILLTNNDPPLSYHPFVNNYFVLNPGRSEQIVIANRYDGFDRKLRSCGAKVRAPGLAITRLAIYRGSIKCVSNQASATALFDWLGIAYRPLRGDGRK